MTPEEIKQDLKRCELDLLQARALRAEILRRLGNIGNVIRNLEARRRMLEKFPEKLAAAENIIKEE